MSAVAYFEIRALPHIDPDGQPQRIPAQRGHEVEQWDRLIAGADPNLYVVAPHDADGTVVGLDAREVTS